MTRFVGRVILYPANRFVVSFWQDDDSYRDRVMATRGFLGVHRYLIASTPNRGLNCHALTVFVLQKFTKRRASQCTAHREFSLYWSLHRLRGVPKTLLNSYQKVSRSRRETNRTQNPHINERTCACVSTAHRLNWPFAL